MNIVVKLLNSDNSIGLRMEFLSKTIRKGGEMKKTFIVSQILLGINIGILIVIPLIFLLLFKLFPNLDPSENGLGVFPLVCIIYGLVGLPITGAFAIGMAIIYRLYLHKRNHYKSSVKNE